MSRLNIVLSCLFLLAHTRNAFGELVVQVKPLAGSPALWIQGEPVSPLMFYGWAEEGQPTEVTIGPQWQEYWTTFVAPEDNAGEAGIHFRVGADGPGTIWVDDVLFYPGEKQSHPEKNWVRQGDWEGTPEQIAEHWTLFQADYAGAKASWTVDSTTQVRGNQSLKIDVQNPGDVTYHLHFHQTGYTLKEGRKYTYSLWMRSDRPRRVDFMALRIGPPWRIYSGGSEDYTAQVRWAREAGIHIYSFGIPFPWPKPGEPWDYTEVDRAFRLTLKNDPEALLLPRFGVGPPTWWLEEHPSERMLFEDGKTEGWSMASRAWLKDLEEPLRRLVRHCEEHYHDHMLGYHPCGQHTGEWFYYRSWEPVLGDFSQAMTQGFSAWAREKYGGLSGLRKAWAIPDLTLEDIGIPAPRHQRQTTLGLFRDPVQERKVIDYFEYKQIAMQKPLERIARIIKEQTEEKKLVCLFYGYTFDMHGIPLGPQGSGHLAMDRMLRCPDVDILCSPISYLDRELGGAGCFMCPVDSVRNSGKLWLNEDDTRTYLSSEDAGYGRVDTLEGTRWIHERNFAQLWPRRLACWYMDLENKGWLHGKEIWENLATFQSFTTQHLKRPSEWNPSVAVIVDERGPFYTACSRDFHSALVYQMRSEFFRMGVPFGIYLMSDLVRGDVPESRVFIFPNAFRLDEGERRAIFEKTQGHAVIWFYGAGFLKDDASVDHISDLVGIRLCEGTPQPGRAVGVEAGSALLKGCEDSMGTDMVLDPLWKVCDEKATPVALYQDGSVAVASKQTDMGLRVYVGVLHCPSGLLRNVLKASGIHLYADSNDVVLTDGHFLCLVATSTGEKLLRFPAKHDILDAFDHQPIASETDTLNLFMEKGQARTFLLE